MILTLEQLEKERPQMEAESKRLNERYNSDPMVKELADKIHEHRMLPPPTCDGCIEIAIARLDRK